MITELELSLYNRTDGSARGDETDLCPIFSSSNNSFDNIFNQSNGITKYVRALWLKSDLSQVFLWNDCLLITFLPNFLVNFLVIFI